MIECINIVPQNYLNFTDKCPMHMCLAHLLGEEGMEEYTAFYKKQSEDGNFVIMDNGVIEGSPLPIDKVLEKAKLVDADEIILPDVFLDAGATIAAVDFAMEYLKNKEHVRLMVVPHGKTLNEWTTCAALLINRWGDKIATVGIPKVLTSVAGRDARIDAIKSIASLIKQYELDIHLLGCWDTPLEITTAALAVVKKEIPVIRSTDSSIAFVYAREGIRFSASERPHNKATIDFKHEEVDNVLLEMNMHEWTNSGIFSNPYNIRSIF